jgi:hypothetical protein
MEPERFTVVTDYRSPYPNSIAFRKDEKVAIGQEFKGDPAWEKWVWCTGANDKQAWVPQQYLNIDGGTGTLKKDYDAKELSVKVGERVIVHNIVNGFGMAEKTNGMRGWVALKHMKRDRP